MNAIAVLAAAVVLVGASAVQPPKSPPPHVSGTAAAPPPAWISVGARSAWMAYSSFCWKTACVDFIPPAQRPDLPRVTVARDVTVRFHLGFAARNVGIVMPSSTKRIALPGGRVIAWRPPARGVVVLDAKGPGGSASYVVRLVAP